MLSTEKYTSVEKYYKSPFVMRKDLWMPRRIEKIKVTILLLNSCIQKISLYILKPDGQDSPLNIET